MLVYLDDHAVSVPSDSLAAALEAVGVAAQHRGRIVIEVLCDGKPASEEFLTGRSAAVCAELRCRSADPAELVAQTLDDAAAELTGLVPDQRGACEKLWAGRTAEAMQDLKGILDRWRLVQEALEQCLRAAGCSLADVTDQAGRSGSELSGMLAGLLEQVRAELGAGRVVELADLLGTDLSTLAESWRGMLLNLKRAVLNEAGGREATS